jgi:hypothetical protein
VGAGRLDGFGEVGAGRLDGFGEVGGRLDGFVGGGGEVGWFKKKKKKKRLPHVSSRGIFVFEIVFFIFKVTNLFFSFFLGVPFLLLLLLQQQQQKRGP